MIILTLRTEKPDAEIAIYDGTVLLAAHSWPAHRQLAESIHTMFDKLVTEAHKEIGQVEGIVVYEGPGSFTGLRIGISIANAWAAVKNIPVVGETSEQWAAVGIKRLLAGDNDQQILPAYGAPVHTTAPKK